MVGAIMRLGTPSGLSSRQGYCMAITGVTVVALGALGALAGEFKTFILKGSVVDLAVGVLIGAAFGKVVDSVVKDLITPLIGMFCGQPDFSSIKLGPLGV